MEPRRGVAEWLRHTGKWQGCRRQAAIERPAQYLRKARTAKTEKGPTGWLRSGKAAFDTRSIGRCRGVGVGWFNSTATAITTVNVDLDGGEAGLLWTENVETFHPLQIETLRPRLCEARQRRQRAARAAKPVTRNGARVDASSHGRRGRAYSPRRPRFAFTPFAIISASFRPKLLTSIGAGTSLGWGAESGSSCFGGSEGIFCLRMGTTLAPALCNNTKQATAVHAKTQHSHAVSSAQKWLCYARLLAPCLSPELRNQLLEMAREWMRAVIDEEDGTATPAPE